MMRHDRYGVSLPAIDVLAAAYLQPHFGAGLDLFSQLSTGEKSLAN
jgi:hypothetical protein